MESSVRVVVADRPRLLRELVLSTLSGQAGIEVVGEAQNEQDVPSLGLAICDAGCSGVAGLQEVFVDATSEWRCTGHVVHVQPNGSPQGVACVGVGFDCYEVLQLVRLVNQVSQLK